MSYPTNSSLSNLILYVEDEDIQAKIFSKIIENEVKEFGFKVIVFNNGKEFIELLNSKHSQYKISQFSTILLDLSMHDVSGFTMLEEFKAKSMNVPIAILTARQDEDIKNKIMNLGAKEYFVKGKDIDELERLKNFILQSTKST